MRSSSYTARCCYLVAPAVLAVALLLSSSVGALAGSLSATYFRVEADNDSGFASWDVSTADPSVSYDPGTHTWSWSTGLRALANGALLNDATLTVVGDPAEFRRIGLTFSANAGDSDTIFTIRTAVLTFDSPLSSAETLASPSLTLTRQGDAHTAWAWGTGGDSGTYAYAAYYNGSMAHELLPGLTTETSETQSANSGWVAASGAVSTMRAQYAFEVSAGDQIGGSSNYVITPEPASVALLVLVGLASSRRRF